MSVPCTLSDLAATEEHLHEQMPGCVGLGDILLAKKVPGSHPGVSLCNSS